MNCRLRDHIAWYVDEELGPAAQQEFSAHLSTCSECPSAIGEQMELKKALRVAGGVYAAPPELHSAVYRQLHPQPSVNPWWKWAAAPTSALLLGLIGFLLSSRSHLDPMMTALVDQHTTMLASEHPVDVVSDNRHNVKPWFQGRLPFTFNMPNVVGSPFTLVGAKVAYVAQNPSAELLYTVGQHKISVFILQASKAEGKSGSGRDRPFTVDKWSEGGLQCYLITDASQQEVRKLVLMFREANRS